MSRLAAIALTPLLLFGCAHSEGTAQPAEQKPVVEQPVNEARQLSTADAAALADFKQRLDGYVGLHRRLETDLPEQPKEATPAVIDARQRALEKALRAQRSTAKVGDLLTPPVRRIFRRVLAQVFAGQAGRDMMATILDDNPGPIQLMVNGRYPDEVPLSTVPPQVLSSLPKLPEELEYRFVGERLVLLDVHAHTIADYMDNAFPR
jgi:hypothetical protein